MLLCALFKFLSSLERPKKLRRFKVILALSRD
jgi:hypothetical protein